MTNRNRDEHIERTKEGIAHFKARTGNTWGRKPIITAEQIEKFRAFYDTGNYSVLAASKHAGISNAYFYMNREAVLAWKKGDPWPLPRPPRPRDPAIVDLFPARAVGDEK